MRFHWTPERIEERGIRGRQLVPYTAMGRGWWRGMATKATGGLVKGAGFRASMVALDAGIRGASPAIHAGEVEEIEADQSSLTGIVVVNSKGDSQGSPIMTYIMAATVIILFIMAGPCIIKKIRSFITRNKKPASPDSEKIIPLGDLPNPMPARAPDTDHEKGRGRVILAPYTDYDREWFKAAMTQDTKCTKEIFKSITLDNI